MQENKKIGVIGGGVLGSALKNYYTNAKVYDKHKESDALEEVLTLEYIFICVPTPYNEKGFDKSYLEEVFEHIGSENSERTVIIKSTVIPGTTDYFQKKYPHLKIIFNPEFLTEQTAEQDFRFPDRQIAGYTEKSFNVARDVLELLPLAPFERIVPAKAAEMIKYFGNTWFATKVVFANQMFDLCEKLGVDYDEVKEAAAADKRIGRGHLNVWHKDYRGYGGKCLPKDTRTFIDYAKNCGVELELLKKVEEINNKLREGQDRGEE